MRLTLVLCTLIFIQACGTTINGQDYLELSPKFTLEQFFDGDVKAWGIVQNRSGKVVQRFQVDIVGTWQPPTLTLDETFSYGLGDGVTERVWTISKIDDGLYQGSATDIPGPAQGVAYGNAISWRYEMDLPVGDTSYHVKFDDWMWAFDDQTIINRSYIKKFGFVVAEVTLFMQRQ